jgi:hypothetical protein
MNMGKRIGLLVLLAIWLPAGQAAIRQIEQAFELRPEQLQLPARPDAQLTIRPCANCRVVALQVTAKTLWYAGMAERQPAGQAAVLEIYRTASSDPRTLVHVYYEPQTLRVKRIVLDLPQGVKPR